MPRKLCQLCAEPELNQLDHIHVVTRRGAPAGEPRCRAYALTSTNALSRTSLNCTIINDESFAQINAQERIFALNLCRALPCTR